MDEFIQGYFAAHPVTATSVGAHEFDSAMKAVSPGSVVKVAGVDLRGNPFSVYLRMEK